MNEHTIYWVDPGDDLIKEFTFILPKKIQALKELHAFSDMLFQQLSEVIWSFQKEDCEEEIRASKDSEGESEEESEDQSASKSSM